jgi:hypothetical protein
MSLGHGSKITTNALISCLDASNRKSFSGIGNERLGDIYASFGNWNGLVGTSENYTSKYGEGVYLNITNNNGGGVNWWNSVNGAQACLSSTQYVITARVKYIGNTPNPNLFYVRQYNSGGSQTSESGKYSSSNQVLLSDGYYLVWAYFTTDSTAVSFLVQGYDYSNIQIWLQDVQCKLAGLNDISGNNNNGSLVGGMSRTGTNSGVIQLTNTNYILTGLNLSTGNYTVISAARWTGGANLRVITAASNNWLMGHWNNSTENYFAEGWISAVSSGASDTNWRILASTGSTTYDSWQMYVNGVQTYSNSNGAAGPNNLGINANASERSNCEIGFLLVYNRVLSADEIKQNFNAMRGRYGI